MPTVKYGTRGFEREVTHRLVLGVVGTLLAPLTCGLSLLMWIPYANIKSGQKAAQQAQRRRASEKTYEARLAAARRLTR